MSIQKFESNKTITLETGKKLKNVSIAYHTYGNYKKNITPVIWVCHALTASSDVADWWANIFGQNKTLDPTKYFIVCANIIGSSYGSTSPISINPSNNKKYSKKFPLITIRDLVAANIMLKTHLDIDEIFLLIGGSMGGQQAMEWAIQQPLSIKKLVLLATNAKHSAWGIAFNEAQRMALETSKKGLQVARAIAMLSYRNYEMYERTAKENDTIDNYGAASYQRYQGQKLAKRFDADCYYILSKAMDSHDVGRGRQSITTALATIAASTLVIGIATDILFPIKEQIFLYDNIKNSKLELINSPYGHDGFLTEGEKINKIIINFMNA
ncbi:MAG: homoserine O-acetyltransferase [Ferruginibacter sp.]|nr:homoserine O-acetyltransferase [Ferruginibacter sp.]